MRAAPRANCLKAQAQQHSASLFSEVGFVLFLIAQVLASGAQTLWMAALAWQVYDAGGSAASLGSLGLAQFAATFVFSLPGGAVADGVDRVRIYRAQISVAAACIAWPIWSASTGSAGLAGLYVVAFVTAAASAFGQPAASALLLSLVPESRLPEALTWSSSLKQVARMSGPVIFGFVSQGFGIPAAYAVQFLALVGALACLAFVVPRYAGSRRTPATLASVAEGLRFLRGRPALLGAMSLDMIAVIFAGAIAILPIYARDILDVGAGGYGLLASAIDLGTVLMAGVLVWLPPIRRAGVALICAVVVFGAATVLFGISRSFVLSLVALMVAGMADQVSMVSRSLIIQLSTPDEFRGRVSGVNLLFIGASNQLGGAESGYLAALTSAPFSVIFGGIVCSLAAVGAWVGLPSLRLYRTRSGLAASDPAAPDSSAADSGVRDSGARETEPAGG